MKREMAAESPFMNRAAAFYFKWRFSTISTNSYNSQAKLLSCSRIRASSSTEDENKLYKQLGLFSLKKKIEDAVLRAEMSAPTALELEETRRMKQEEVMREFDLWDDPVKFNEILGGLADSVKLVDSLRDLKYKVEEARLISQLAEVEGINYELFKQGYSTSLDVNKLLDQYEMAKLLKGPYDKEGACVTIRAGSESINAQMWAENLLSMYIKWAKKLGHNGRLVDKHLSINSNASVLLASIEFEFECAYGYLLGERGLHRMINQSQVDSACVDVIPLFLGAAPDLEVKDEDLIISCTLHEENSSGEPTVCIQHIPTGISVQSSGERNQFANKVKALNRLKAKLVVIAEEQKVTDINSIKKEKIEQVWEKERRRYVCVPYKLVQDVKTGIQLPDLNSILDGNIEPLLGAHIRIRHTD
ncbi:peptide chain release factor PrfB3, chloroplastic isoform X1 [Euphorbia lathyris]|uniref:peptide chain release factor PrfB3, chloroplastic isoform X1 n=2 Tax=Euphorbia lathyris TaxID=212925 RepID=UPI003313843E